MGIFNKVLISTVVIVLLIASTPKLIQYNNELNCMYESFIERNRIETILKMDSVKVNNRLIYEIETLYDKINSIRDDEYKLERENFDNIYMDANRISKFNLDMLDVSNLQETTYNLNKKKEVLERIFGYETEKDMFNDDIIKPNIDLFENFKEDNSKLDGKQYLNDFQEFMFNKCMKKE